MNHLMRKGVSRSPLSLKPASAPAKPGRVVPQGEGRIARLRGQRTRSKRMNGSWTGLIALACLLSLSWSNAGAQVGPVEAEDYRKYAIYESTAPRPGAAKPQAVTLPLELKPGDRIALIGNTLLERVAGFRPLRGPAAAAVSQAPARRAAIWPGRPMTIDLQPRPANFADTRAASAHEKTDVIFAAFGFNESFAGDAGLPAFRRQLAEYRRGSEVEGLQRPDRARASCSSRRSPTRTSRACRPPI